MTIEQRLNISIGTKKAMQNPDVISKISKTWFKKGEINNPMTESMRIRLSKSHFGKKLSEEHKKNIGISKKGIIPSNIEMLKTYMLGRNHTEETKRKISIANTGSKNGMWIKDRNIIDRKARNNPDYVQWRKKVWLRDNFKCKIANPDCKGRLEAHHILGWKFYPKLRYEVNNGITLCHAHHPRKRSEEARLSPYFQKLVAEMK